LRVEVVSSSEKQGIFSNVKRAIWGAVAGYVTFLSILLVTKVLSSMILAEKVFEVETLDFVVPTVGFVLLFIIKLLENLKE